LLIALAEEGQVRSGRTAKLDEPSAQFALRGGQIGGEALGGDSIAETSLRVSGLRPLTGWKVLICNFTRYRLLK
jgi:hypothetical protein